MQRNCTKIVVFALILGWWLASPATSSAQDWARKMFTEYQHDFGIVAKESRPEHKFEITNVYLEDIRIRDVFSSCGCTSVSITKRVLKQGETGYLIARFNSHIVDGPKQATITVRFDAPYVGEVQLVVRGNSASGGGISLSSKQLDFGQVVTGQSSERVVELTRQGDTSFEITDVLSTFPHIGVSLEEKFRGRGVVKYDVKIRLKETVPVGYSQGELFIVGQSGVQRYKVPVKFTAKVVEPIQISPGIMTLSPVKPGEEVSRKVIVKADQPFRITDVTCHSRAFRVRADGTTKKVHMVDVIYTGEDDPGHHECFLTFQTSHGGNSTAKMKAIVDIVTDAEASTTSNETVSKNEAP